MPGRRRLAVLVPAAGLLAVACATQPAAPVTASDQMIADSCQALLASGCAGNDPERENIIANVQGLWGGSNSCYAQRQRCLETVAAESRTETSRLEQKVAEMEARKAAQESEVALLERDVAAIERDNAIMRAELDAMAFANAQQQARLTTARSSLAVLEGKTERLKAELAEKTTMSDQQVRELASLEAERVSVQSEVEALAAAFRKASTGGS